jgi:hypothetical protein
MREDAAVTEPSDPFAPPAAGAPEPARPVIEPPAFGEPIPVGRKNGLGTAALVLGILSIFPFCGLVIPGVLAVVFGLVGRARAKRGEANNGGVALAGVITGVIGLVISALLVVWVVSLVRSPEFDRFTDCFEAAQTSQQEDDCVQTLVDEWLD